ncbi:hypothetical protein [Vibrio maerlii]|uniref:hypothetical protein n=1 Tax=Vibrio maerlii TaxID=2231648 RepID=UPI000E3C2275|nr:hypothetical protein [Vibrio maerlii]
MPNLTKDQKTLLESMNHGLRLQVCSDYCPNQWTITTSPKAPVRIFKKTIQKLYQNGLISYQPIHHFGVRWDEFVITQKGRQAV